MTGPLQPWPGASRLHLIVSQAFDGLEHEVVVWLMLHGAEGRHRLESLQQLELRYMPPATATGDPPFRRELSRARSRLYGYLR